MRAYAETLQIAMASHAPLIGTEMIGLGAASVGGRWAQRMASVSLLARARAVRGLHPDIWHVLDGSRAYVAATLGPEPVIVTAHDIIPVRQARGDFPAAPKVGWAARWLWQGNARATRRAAAVVAVSESTKVDLGACIGVANGRTTVVPMPLRQSLARLLAGAEAERVGGRVLHVGNNAFYKNRPQVLRIFAAMDATLATELVMVGPPPPSELRQLVSELGLSGRVRWEDGADDHALAHWYRSAMLMLFPSVYEGFGWPALEAMAFALPVVASNAGSLPEVIGDAAACLRPDATADFVAKAEALLRSPDHWESSSRRALMRAAQFSEQRFAQQMQDIYLRIARPEHGSWISS